MPKTLIIAEKPSVANDLQRVLGKAKGMSRFTKEQDYFENDTHVISSAVGHLVELAMPNLPNGKKPAWNFDSLPIIPDSFTLLPIEKSKSRLNLLKKLMKRKDVDTIVNACDAGREGELIFHYLISLASIDKPVKRLWMQSMTDQAIQDAFAHLRGGDEMAPLADAAVCRSESDWLVGINGTRALTAFNSRNGGFLKTPVGRVQTPTLTLLVEREKEIQSFVPRTYWEVYGDFGVADGSYRGRWIREGFKKDEDDPHLRAERIWSLEDAEAVRERCLGKDATVEEKKKPTRQGAPLLYDLTSLQREANGRFGFSARRTLQLAQMLYEREKVLTYPRTDSRFLPDDYVETVRSTLSTFASLQGSAMKGFPADLVAHCGTAVNTHGVKPNKRIFDGSKVSDHFAIIPTGQVPKKLDESLAKLYRLVLQRFIAVFFPPAEFEVTTRITRVGEDAFKTDGKVLVRPGWLEVYGKEASSANGEDSLAAVQPGETAKNEDVEVKESETKPPPHYNESTLLSAMEGAGKLVEDDELAAAMSERGLGTPATRAAIIEGLIQEKYVLREGKDLYASRKAIALVDQVREIGVDVLTSPELTGQWEHKLKQMEHGDLSRESFMREIRDMTESLVSKTRDHLDAVRSRVFPDLDATCPACGSRPLRQTDSHFDCTNPECQFRIFKAVSGRELTEAEAKQLISSGFVGPLSGFRSRFGAEFEAALELKEEKGKHKVGFVFEGEDESSNDAGDVTPDQLVCEFGKGKIYETDTFYALVEEGSTTFDKKIRIPKELCKQQIPREQARKFFADGKTDVIEQFISKKGRPFSASLIFEPTAKKVIRWEFPPRAPKKKAAKKKAAAPAKKKEA